MVLRSINKTKQNVYRLFTDKTKVLPSDLGQRCGLVDIVDLSHHQHEALLMHLLKPG